MVPSAAERCYKVTVVYGLCYRVYSYGAPLRNSGETKVSIRSALRFILRTVPNRVLVQFIHMVQGIKIAALYASPSGTPGRKKRSTGKRANRTVESNTEPYRRIPNF